jgi:hypothetical protein
MAPDTLDQYSQALSNTYGDWHPPIMAGFWRMLNFIHKGPLMMLVFQLLLLWSSFYILATSWFSQRKHCFLLLFLLFLAPYVQNFAGYIIKDVQMALCWLLACCIILRASYHKRKMTQAESIFSFVLITYGTLIRINALPGAAALYFFWIGSLYTNTVKRLSLLVVTIVLVAILPKALNKYLFKAEKLYPEYKLMAHDLTGIYISTHVSYFPRFIQQYAGFDTAYLRSQYTPATFDNIWWNADNKRLFPGLNDSTNKELFIAWKNAITSQKAAYLANHWNGFLYYLRIKERKEVQFFYYFPFIHPNEYGFLLHKNIVRTAFCRYIEKNSRMPYMKPWFWFLLPLLLIIITLRQPGSPLQLAGLCLSASSLLYLLPQFFIYQVDTEFRYFYWSCIAAALHVTLLIINYHSKNKKPVPGIPISSM